MDSNDSAVNDLDLDPDFVLSEKEGDDSTDSIDDNTLLEGKQYNEERNIRNAVAENVSLPLLFS